MSIALMQKDGQATSPRRCPVAAETPYVGLRVVKNYESNPVRIRRLRRLLRVRTASPTGHVLRRCNLQRDEDARQPSRTYRPGSDRARASASALPCPLAPVRIMRETPAWSARLSTSSRSASKLSCVRFAPMSIRSKGASLPGMPTKSKRTKRQEYNAHCDENRQLGHNFDDPGSIEHDSARGSSKHVSKERSRLP